MKSPVDDPKALSSESIPDNSPVPSVDLPFVITDNELATDLRPKKPISELALGPRWVARVPQLLIGLDTSLETDPATVKDEASAAVQTRTASSLDGLSHGEIILAARQNDQDSRKGFK